MQNFGLHFLHNYLMDFYQNERNVKERSKLLANAKPGASERKKKYIPQILSNKLAFQTIRLTILDLVNQRVLPSHYN